ncbi:MAG: cadherin-like beta sandwich domain-containing protein, partial [Rhodoluna sp.]|nr:cadherin-like beta sandwich domain-containing protein [Rhodoluna sp.]
MRNLIAAVLLAVLPVSGIVPLGTQLSYAIEADQDTSLQSFKADGVEVVDGQTINLPQGTTTILIEASTTDIFAEAITSQNSDNLQPGANTVTVTVTAADGSTQEVYTLYVIVAAPSSDATLRQVVVGGEVFSGALDGTGVFQAAVGTTQVTVTATANSLSAQVSVTGNTNLVTGSENTVAIHVIAENGATADYSFKVTVATPNSNTNLSSFLINGSAVSDNDIFEVPYGTSAVAVSVVTAAGTSTYSYTGNTGLTTGDHTVTVTVTSQAGTTANHSVVIRVVAVSTDRIINSITIDGTELIGSSANVATGVTSVDVVVTLNSGFSSYSVEGNTGLDPGANTITVTVTSQDGVSEELTITVNVYIPSNDSSLSYLEVDGQIIVASEAFVVGAYVTSVAVIALATDENATVVITGNTELATGSNLVAVTVTAEDGSQTTITFTVQVSLSSNTGVTSIMIDGVNRSSETSAVQNTAKLATSVAVAVITADENSTFTVTGDDDLDLGSNTLIITVTAPDGSVATYERGVFVPGLSTNNALTSITVDGETVVAGENLTRAHGVTSVSVQAVTADDFATYEVLGDTNLVTGSNTVSVKVTAEDASIATYSFTVQVELSSDASVASITIEGVDRTSASSAIQDTSKLATSVSVVVVTTNADATYSFVGHEEISTGLNEITISVTAPDGTVATYVRLVNVPILSSDNALSSITIDGVQVLAGGSVSKAYGVTSVDVVVDPADDFATYSVSGSSGLVSGANTVTVAVTAED